MEILDLKSYTTTTVPCNETRLICIFLYKSSVFIQHKTYIKFISLSFGSKSFNSFRVAEHQNLNLYFCIHVLILYQKILLFSAIIVVQKSKIAFQNKSKNSNSQ